MENNIKKEKDKLTRTFDFIVYILDYIYKELVAFPKDFLSEIHLRFFRYNKNPNKKILGYWDFNQRLSRLGDFMGYLEILSILRTEFNLKENQKNIDLCFIDDKNHYNAKQLRFSKTFKFKKDIQSLNVINPYLDSVFIFKSNKEFERFYQQNRKRYIRWPPTVSATEVLDYRMVEKFYKKKKFIPKLNLPPEVLRYTYSFYEKEVYPSLPVIINIRNNPERSGERNSNIQELKRFLKHYEKNKSYKFVIICNKLEIPLEFRNFKNVLFSKDFFEGVEMDLALIETSYLCIFPDSGMGCYAWFNGVPFIQYGIHGDNKYSGLKKGKIHNFFTKHQRYYHRTETAEWLIKEFENLTRILEKEDINNTLRNRVKDNKKYEAQF